MDRASDAASSPFTLLPKKNSTRVEIVNSDGVFGSLIFLFLPFFSGSGCFSYTIRE